MLLTVFALVGAAFKVDLHNNVYDDVASGVACPPQWLPVVLAAGISPQLPAPDESRWSDATPVAEEPNRGRLLSHGSVCPDDASLGCKGSGNWWFKRENCCKRCSKPGGGIKEIYECKHSSTCGCSSIAASTDSPPPSPPPPSPPPSLPTWHFDHCPSSIDFGCVGQKDGWYSKAKCCTECAPGNGGGSVGPYNCQDAKYGCGCSTVDAPAPPPPLPPPAPPCTVEMLKARPAGDKNWPVACSHATLGEADKELDLNGAHLSYGDFEEATFQAKGAIKLNGAGLAHADLSGSEFTAAGGGSDGSYSANIDFAGANLANADLSGSKLTAAGLGGAAIDFTEANLTNADLSGSKITADSSYGAATINFAEVDLDHVDLSGSEITAKSRYDDATINFAEANLANADMSGSTLTATAGYGSAAIDFTAADLTNAYPSGSLPRARRATPPSTSPRPISPTPT